MKPTHPDEVAALAAVVRVTFTELETHGRAPSADAAAALMLIDAWITGADVSPDRLQAAADASHQERVPFAAREKDRARSWAATAAGNLAWMAKKDRGWKDGCTSIMDAAFHALSSLGVPGTPDADQLEAARASALAAANSAPRAAVPRPPKPRARSTDLATYVGASANAALASRSPSFDPKRAGTPDQLTALLHQHGYPAHPSVLAFDARYGGLLAADAPGEAGHDWLFGAFACLTSQAHVDPSDALRDLVPVAYSPNDGIFYLDQHGAAWAVDTIAEQTAAPFAASGDLMMAKIFLEA